MVVLDTFGSFALLGLICASCTRGDAWSCLIRLVCLPHVRCAFEDLSLLRPEVFAWSLETARSSSRRGRSIIGRYRYRPQKKGHLYVRTVSSIGDGTVTVPSPKKCAVFSRDGNGTVLEEVCRFFSRR